MKKTRGFTLIELLVVIGLIALIVGLLVPALAKAQRTSKSNEDAMQISQVHKSNIIYALDNNGRYMIPGLVNRLPVKPSAGPELAGLNIPGMGSEDPYLNTTPHLYSALIAQGFFAPELVVGPTETNPEIRVKTDYNYDAYDPASDSYWDTSFDIKLGIPGTTSNASYAHLALGGERFTQKWRTTASSNDPVFSTRGTKKGVTSGPDYARSPTLQLHGPREEWYGNVCFNDNHVEMLNTFWPPQTSYEPPTLVPPQPLKDNIFAAEFPVPCGNEVKPEAAGDAYLLLYDRVIPKYINAHGIFCTKFLARYDRLLP